MSWRLARSLATLRSEVNAFAPHRNKYADGTIGDQAHASRASRHNPNSAGVVCAIDITHDPAGGMDVHALVRRLVLNPHSNLAYIVSNRQIASRDGGFRWRAYNGSSPHTAHAHIAVGRGPDSEPTPPYDDTDSWGVALVPEEDDMFTDQDRALLKEVSKKLDRSFLSDVARSYDWLLEAARDAGDAAEIERLKVKRAEALAEIREALGL